MFNDEPMEIFREDIEFGYIYKLGNEELYSDYNRVLEFEDIISLGESFYSSLLNSERELKFLNGNNRGDIVEYIYDILTLRELGYVFDLNISKIENLKDIFLYEEDLHTPISRQEGISIFTRGYELYKYAKALDSKGILYEIKNNDKEIYILGTIHAGDKSIYPFSKNIIDIINKAEVLSVEANIIEDLNGASYLMSKGTIDDGELKDYLSEELYSKLENTMEKLDDDIDNYSYSKPWFIAMLLEGIKVSEANIDTNAGIDLVILNYFINSNKEIVELEGIKYQVDLFNNMEKDLEGEFLLSSLESMEDSDDKIDAYLEAWRVGDANKFDDLVYDVEGDMTEGIQNALLKKRNEHILDKIEEYFNDDKIYLVTLGTGHLFGKDGILKVLKENYNVKQII